MLSLLDIGYLIVNKKMRVIDYNDLYETTTGNKIKKRKILSKLKQFKQKDLDMFHNVLLNNSAYIVYNECTFILQKYILLENNNVCCFVKSCKDCETHLGDKRHNIKNKLNQMLLETNNSELIMEIASDIDNFNIVDICRYLF